MWRSGSPGASCLRIWGSFSVYKGFSEVDLHLPTSILKPKHDPPMYVFFRGFCVAVGLPNSRVFGIGLGL